MAIGVYLGQRPTSWVDDATSTLDPAFPNNADVQRIHATALPRLFKPPAKDVFPPAAVIELLANPHNHIYTGQLDGEDSGVASSRSPTRSVELFHTVF